MSSMNEGAIATKRTGESFDESKDYKNSRGNIRYNIFQTRSTERLP